MKIPLCKASIGINELNAVKEILLDENPWLTHGPKNKEFEENFAKYIGVKYAVTVNSCASALLAAIEAYKLKGEIILPSFTHMASAHAIMKAGCKPIFVDINKNTFNIDSEKIREKINKNTVAIMPVHFGGQSCEMNEIMKIAEENNLKVIEDSAECIGGTFDNKKTGSFGIGCFSFFPTKNLTTGEGGMITSNDDEFIERIKLLIAHGVVKDKERNWYRDSVIPAYNFRMSNLNAAIGVEQLKKLDLMNEKRREHADYYNKNIKIKGIKLPIEYNKCKHVYQMYVIKVDKKIRDNLLNYLRENGIEASVHFDPPVHLQNYYKGNYNLSVTEELCKRVITLPMFPDLSKNKLDYIIEKVEEGFKKFNS